MLRQGQCLCLVLALSLGLGLWLGMRQLLCLCLVLWLGLGLKLGLCLGLWLGLVLKLPRLGGWLGSRLGPRPSLGLCPGLLPMAVAEAGPGAQPSNVLPCVTVVSRPTLAFPL